MPMDGFTLSFLQQELHSKLLGGRIDKVNQPERDVLVLMIRSGVNYRLLLSANASQARVQFTQHAFENPAQPPMFCMLMRKHLLGARITDIKQIAGDRILAIVFEGMDDLGYHVQKTLYIEIMGRHSNITLTNEDSTIIDSIHHVNSEMSRVRTVLPGGTYQLPPQPDKLTPDAITPDALKERLQALSAPLFKGLMQTVAGMATVCAKEICVQVGLDPLSPCDEVRWDIVAGKLSDFYHGQQKILAPVTLYDETGLAMDFFPFPYQTFSLDRQKAMPSISEAMDAYYLGRDIHLRMQQRGAGLQKHIKNAIDRTEKKKGIMADALNQSEKAEEDRICGDLLTANMHLLQKGQESITVSNYYDENYGDITISLSALKTPSQNAQSYYKKYRKAKVAEQYARDQLKVIESDLLLLEGALEDLEKCETTVDMEEIRFALTQSGFLRPDASLRKKKKMQEGKPYKFTAADGTVIEVGKNSIQNDRLTLHARGNETWLHAQGIPGSHVIVRTESDPSDETLLYAAQLAAYFSKGRNHPALPVDYTKRKHVKKASGTAPGFVTYTNFQTALIGLSPEDITRITNDIHQ